MQSFAILGQGVLATDQAHAPKSPLQKGVNTVSKPQAMTEAEPNKTSIRNTEQYIYQIMIF